MLTGFTIRSFFYYMLSVGEWGSGVTLALLTLLASQDAEDYNYGHFQMLFYGRRVTSF